MAKKIKRKEVFEFIDSLISDLDAREKRVCPNTGGKICRDTINKLDQFRAKHETPEVVPGVSCMDVSKKIKRKTVKNRLKQVIAFLEHRRNLAVDYTDKRTIDLAITEIKQAIQDLKR